MTVPRRLVRAVVIICALQMIRLVVLDRALPDFVRGGRPFVISGVSANATISQEFATRGGPLALIAVSADVNATGGFIDAVLFEVGNAGERDVRRATIDVRSQGDRCCTMSFDPLEPPRGREYRLELKPRAAAADFQLALRARPVRNEGGLTLNGRRQYANLALDAGPTPLARMRGEPRISLWFVMGCFAVIDAALAYVVSSLWRNIR